MKKIILTALILLATGYTSLAQQIKDYTLHISKIDQEAANLHVECTFALDFEAADSVAMNFGGALDFSVDNLQLNRGDFTHAYNPELKNIVFHRQEAPTVQICMDYDYTNLSAFYIYGESSAELWESSYGEHFYPYIPNTPLDLSIRVKTPDSLLLLCSYPLEKDTANTCGGNLKGILSQSIVLAFLQRDAYRCTTARLPHEVAIYQITSLQCGKERYDELLELTEASIAYFSEVYGEDYICGQRNIRSFPSYLFHDGKGFSNRYNIGFISASQEKFSTYPDIYPLVHEIGHRWLGEWTLLIDDGEPGAYFIKESLNEFMTLQFIRHFYGSQPYEQQLARCWAEYGKIEGTSEDEPLVDLVTNHNNTVVYRKGPLVLDRIARKIGYDQLIRIIATFYREHAGKYPLRYTDLIDLINTSEPGVGDELNDLLSTTSLE